MRPIDWKGICGQAALNRTRPWQFDDRLCHHHWTCKERRWRRIAADTRKESYPFKSHNQPPPLSLHSVIALSTVTSGRLTVNDPSIDKRSSSRPYEREKKE
ncbi:hypothetical protein T10_10523 [Trichinella papuae]|uniref:Uncharacterized protein n=1 Tax=Trichinella papuae TaxID=268474 RepID=A0A0V1MV56_9BILA|nr:hypothetical protein T10_10523 [Trichinella papuae]